ncbi:hypothetical protein C8Q80DRAFT_802755 [Daedaleopsis nitida]|nr:hypothetical protein C8Q80DRAFT_802755 [Daedaleopsis nitida]
MMDNVLSAYICHWWRSSNAMAVARWVLVYLGRVRQVRPSSAPLQGPGRFARLGLAVLSVQSSPYLLLMSMLITTALLRCSLEAWRVTRPTSSLRTEVLVSGPSCWSLGFRPSWDDSPEHTRMPRTAGPRSRLILCRGSVSESFIAAPQEVLFLWNDALPNTLASPRCQPFKRHLRNGRSMVNCDFIMPPQDEFLGRIGMLIESNGTTLNDRGVDVRGDLRSSNSCAKEDCSGTRAPFWLTPEGHGCMTTVDGGAYELCSVAPANVAWKSYSLATWSTAPATESVSQAVSRPPPKVTPPGQLPSATTREPPRSRADEHPDAERTGPLRCLWGGGCGAVLRDATVQEIRAHLRDTHGIPGRNRTERIPCLWDGRCARTSDAILPGGMGKHIATCHLKSMRKSCASCGQAFCRQDSLARHELLYCPNGRGERKKGPASRRRKF